MGFEQVANEGYILRLEKGEEVIGALKKFALKRKIKGCWFSGIGAVRNAELAYYDMERKAYDSRKFEEDMEVVSLSGTISWLSTEPVVHAHIVLSDREMKAFGGHLMSAFVSATLEVFILLFDEKLERRKDSETGLNILNI